MSGAIVSGSDRRVMLVRSPTLWIGGLITMTWVVFAIFGDFVTGFDPLEVDLLARNEAPSGENWLGTDRLGRDVLSRLLAGSRQVLLIAPTATMVGTIFGTALGLITGYYRGWVDEILSRIFDAVLSIPVIITAILVLAAIGANTGGIIFVIAFGFTPIIARTVRAATLAESNLDYVVAARLRGDNGLYIMFVEILPNVLPPIIVEFTVRLGFAIFAVLTLAFLGFGVDPSIPDWGRSIADHYEFLSADVWWPTLFPALAVASLVVGVNLLADGIRQVFES